MTKYIYIFCFIFASTIIQTSNKLPKEITCAIDYIKESIKQIKNIDEKRHNCSREALVPSEKCLTIEAKRIFPAEDSVENFILTMINNHLEKEINDATFQECFKFFNSSQYFHILLYTCFIYRKEKRDEYSRTCFMTREELQELDANSKYYMGMTFPKKHDLEQYKNNLLKNMYKMFSRDDRILFESSISSTILFSGDIDKREKAKSNLYKPKSYFLTYVDWLSDHEYYYNIKYNDHLEYIAHIRCTLDEIFDNDTIKNDIVPTPQNAIPKSYYFSIGIMILILTGCGAYYKNIHNIPDTIQP